MTKAMARARWACAVLAVAGMTAGCGASVKSSPDEVTGTTRQALASSNGLGQNGLSTNGLWTNGLWTNGLWTNGLWTNGLWTNGLWTNGLWTNGLWTNGLWTNGLWTNGLGTNGLWTNGLWSNGLWTNGLELDGGVAAGSPASTLQQSPYARELLQYVYKCAMPAVTYDTTLDPNGGTLFCSPPAPCEAGADADEDGGSTCSTQPTCPAGYACSGPNNTCVIPLTGGIGLAINSDGTHWWDPPATSEAGAGEAGATKAGTSEAGTCDESCQRWVSACVLARTNAYGVHVEISMRASSNLPPGSQSAQIQAALATSQAEVAPCQPGTDPSTCGYTLREGAYYGNIFETTPTPVVCSGPPSSCTRRPRPMAEPTPDRRAVRLPARRTSTLAPVPTATCRRSPSASARARATRR